MIYSFLRPLLFQLEPEQAHHLTFKLLKYIYPSFFHKFYLDTLPKKTVEVCGLKFKNPIGLAAGLDKNGEYIDLLSALGFGFIELGTVTPKPQAGNSKPRLFRIPQAKALINRMGFNNLGVDYLVNRLQQCNRNYGTIIGANLGKNKDTPLDKAALDYCYCLAKVYPYIDYVTINISSPNTPGLRQLQTNYFLEELLIELMKVREALAKKYLRQLPLWVKISPDLSEIELEDMAKLFLKYEINAVVATNTTLDHHSVENYLFGHEEGGLSGLPLFDLSTKLIFNLNQMLQGKIPIIAVGGIMSEQQASAKLAAGASLIQIYTGLIYEGPGIIRKILKN